MPNEEDRISNKIKDFIRNMLVPDPMKRPTIQEIMRILNNWDSYTP